jgi:aspartate dehydrogenase
MYADDHNVWITYFMKIAIIGHGAIAEYVRAQLPKYDIHEVTQIVRPGKEARGDIPRVSNLGDLKEKPELIVDCAGHAALAAHGPVALELGIDVLTVSLGALADAGLDSKLRAAAIKGCARLHLTSGAIGGLDALRAASTGAIDTVIYTGRKPPSGWQGSPADGVIDLQNIEAPIAHFTGTARQAALQYPKNANVAAAVALAGIGFDLTEVSLVADPTISTNIHEICAAGAFGDFRFTISGNNLPDNPRSSALAAMSVVADLAERQKPIGF